MSYSRGMNQHQHADTHRLPRRGNSLHVPKVGGLLAGGLLGISSVESSSMSIVDESEEGGGVDVTGRLGILSLSRRFV
jgi:hypothetical protein